MVKRRMGRCLAVAFGAILWAGPATAQLRWSSFLHGGETYCVQARGASLWAGTSAGIRVYEPGAAGSARVRELTLPAELPGSSVSALYFEPNAAWVGLRTGVIARLDLETNAWRAYDDKAKLPNAPIARIISDGQDLWAATLGGGVARLNALKQEWEVWNQDEGVSSQVRCLAGNQTALWAGTEQGLYRLQRANLKWEPVRAKDALGGRINDIALSPRNLWVATANEGLCRIRLDTGEFYRYDLARYGVTKVAALCLTPEGDLWIATDNGLLRAPQDDTGRAAWAFLEKPLAEVTGVAQSNNAVWVSTRRAGLWRYRGDTGKWEQYAPREALPGSDIAALAPQANFAWCGFRGEGLARYDLRTERWDTIPTPPEAPRRLRDVAVREQMVYCACQDGIAVYDQRAGYWNVLLSRFHAELGGDDWTSVVAVGDNIWFGGPGRVSVFSPTMDLRATYQFSGVEASRDGTLPKLYPDSWSGDMWLVTRGGAWRYQARLNVWGEFSAEYFAPQTPGLFQREGRLIRNLTTDNDSVWLVTLDRVVQYRKQLNQLWYWDRARVPALEEPRLVAADRFAVWVASRAGLCQYDRQSGEWRTYGWSEAGLSGEPTALATDGEEPFVWVATERGVGRLELRAEGARWLAFPPGTRIVSGVRKIVTTPLAVWFVGRDGVTLYRREARGEVTD